MAAVDYFLKIDTIEGESMDHKHKGEIDILEWSFGESQTGTHSGQGGGGAGKVSMQDFHFVMKVNKASSKLFLACASGQHIKFATLVCRKAGTDQQEYLTWKLSDLLVSSYQTGGSASSDLVPTDRFSLNYSKIEVEYKEQKADGSLGASLKAGWNLKENKKV